MRIVMLGSAKTLKREAPVSVLSDEKQNVGLTGYMCADPELDRPLVSF